MGVFDKLPGFGGDGEAGGAEPPDDSGGSGGDADDQAPLAGPGPGEFRERAEALAARSDVPTLDFTVDSLDRLDELAAGPPSAVDDEVAYGSFLGEIIVREYDGEWTADDGWQVAVDLPDDETTIAVFDAAEMSIAEEPVFAKVVDHLEAQGAERTPDVPDEPATGAGTGSTDAGPEPSTESDDEALLGPATVDDEPDGPADDEPTDEDDGPADDERTDEDDGAADGNDTDTVVVDDPVTDPDGPSSDDGLGVVETTDGVAADAGPSPGVDGGPTGDGVAHEPGVAIDAADPDGDASPSRSVDADAANDPEPAPHGPAGREAAAPDATASEAAADPEPADAAATGEADGQDGVADSGLLSSSVLPFGGGTDDTAGGGDDSGDTGESDDAAGDAAPGVTDDAPAAATAVGADADDTPDDDTGTGDPVVDDGDDPAPFVPDSAGTGYSPTEYSTGDSEPGTAGDDESAVADESDDASDDEPTMSISEQIEALGDDGPPATDGEDTGPDSEGDVAAGSELLENGPADDVSGVGGIDDGDADAPDDEDSAVTADDDSEDTTGDDGTGTTGGDGTGTTDADPAAPERYVLRRAADELADGWPERGLDFTPASLPRLDTFVDEQWDGRFRASSLENRTIHHEERGDPLVQLGAYYAEVLIRHLDGEWIATDDGKGAIEVPDVGERVERVDVFAVARECLVPPSTFAYRYDALVNRLHVDEPAVSDGRADVFDDDRDTLTSGDVITQFAATAEDVVEEWGKYPLDYSPRSVRALDEVVDWLTRDVDLVDVPLADGADPESLWLTARATSLGAYLAAVLLRHRDAQWRIDGDEVELVIDRPAGERTVDPVATAADALRGEGSFADAYAALDD